MAFVLLTLFLGNSIANAQVLFGSLTGTITDKSGALVPNINVTATNEGTGGVRTGQSNGQGLYSILDVLPGVYSISVPKTGSFAAYTQKGVAVDANHQVRVDMALPLASVTAEVSVTTAAPELQTDTAQVEADISAAELVQLPVGGSQ